MKKYLDAITLTSVPTGTYLAQLPVIKMLEQIGNLDFTKNITILVGENGTGKSTLLEAIAVLMGFNPEGGSRNFQFATKETHSDLHMYLKAVKRAYPKDGFFLRAESLYNVSTNIDALDEIPAASAKIIESYGGTSLHKQSHGESFLAIVQNRFGTNGLYILDEPEAALSPTSQLALIAQFYKLAQAGSQFIIATHSPMLLAIPDAQILELQDNTIRCVSYNETEHFRLMKQFVNHPEQTLHHLLHKTSTEG